MKNKIFSGSWDKCHCQGIAIDPKGGYIYYSFTTKLVKSDLDGNIIGTVDNIIGHLGCIDFNDNDGKVYASLEYKNDCIGRWIFNALGHEGDIKNGFYSFGDGRFFVSENYVTEDGGQATNVCMYLLETTDGKWSFFRDTDEDL